MRLLFFVPDAASNALSRVQAIWHAAQVLGHDVRLVAPPGPEVWGPFRSSVLHGRIERYTDEEALRSASKRADVLVALKPLGRSLGLAIRCSARYGRPLLLDIDDPDLEVRLRTPLGLLKVLFHPDVRRDGHLRDLLRLRRSAQSVPRMTSNPVLQRRWGGVLVPHASGVTEVGAPYERDGVRVGFLGTVRRHKGVRILRRAVARLADDGFTLLVTGRPTGPTPPWERWVPEPTLHHSRMLLTECDVVAVPSYDHPISRAQLPVKLGDAMLAGRAVVASRVGPLPWALGGAGILVPPHDDDALVRALAAVGRPAVREDLGRRARERALGLFTPAAVAVPLRQALDQAVRNFGPV